MIAHNFVKRAKICRQNAGVVAEFCPLVKITKVFFMDIRKIKKLIDLVNENGIAEIEVKEDKESVHIISNHRPSATNEQAFVSNAQHISPKSQEEAKTPTKEISNSKHTVNSPMVGTVYFSPSPGAKQFIEIGQKVNEGDTLCLIEAMKMFNQIEADKSGTVTERLVDNGQPVEYNQPLFVIE